MSIARRWDLDTLLARWGFYGLGVGSGLLAGLYLVVEGSRFTTLLEALILIGLASTLLYSGRDAARSDLSIDGRRGAVTQTMTTGLSFSLLALAISMIWRLKGPSEVYTSFMITFAGTLGLAVGARLSLYAARREQELATLDELVKLLTISQRVLRHNLRNELAIVSAHLENLGDRLGPDDPDLDGANTHIDKLVTTSRRARRLVDIWDRGGQVDRAVVAIVEEALQLVENRFPDTDVDVTISTRASVAGHPALVNAVEEAIVNAIKHNDGEVDVSLTVSDASPKAVSMIVADTGCGIAESERAVLNQSGETQLSHSIGLGLWLIYWIVAKSGGDLTISENSPSGTIVEMEIPRASDESDSGSIF